MAQSLTKNGETVLSRYAPESIYLLGAGRAILLQLAMPQVGHGVARHSNFAANPVARLHGTLTYIYALSNGTEAQRAMVRDIVNIAHAPVKAAAAKDGSHPAYSARDPRLQLWVAATLYSSAMQIHEHVFEPLAEAEAEELFQQYAVLGTELGMPAELWPANLQEFATYWAETSSQLRVDDTVRGVARELLEAKAAPLWVRALMPLARLMTKGLLGPELRELYGFSWSPRQQRAMGYVLSAARLSVKILPKAVRHVPMHLYLKRLERSGQERQ